jgi:cation-transporting P-type ATPase 13A2
VPGDIIQIPDQTVIPCDIILLKGVAVMNESMLTGESIPAIKNPIPPTNQQYDRVRDAKYTLYGGTKVVQARKEGSTEAYGVVIRTGFQTTKGGLIRDILYPRPNRFSFYRDSLLYIAIFFLLAVIGWAVSIQKLIDLNFDTVEIIQKTGDLVTISVPPTLPAAMTIGTSFSLWRLRKKGIFCISPPRVNVSGRVNVMVLDKTGTLTEDGLQVYGYRRLKGADVNNIEGSAAKASVEFDRFHEQTEFLLPEDHGASYFLEI